MKLYIGIAILICCISSIKVPFIYVLHFLNCAQFLNGTFVLLLAPTIEIFPISKTYVSKHSQRLGSDELVKNLIGFSCE